MQNKIYLVYERVDLGGIVVSAFHKKEDAEKALDKLFLLYEKEHGQKPNGRGSWLSDYYIREIEIH